MASSSTPREHIGAVSNGNAATAIFRLGILGRSSATCRVERMRKPSSNRRTAISPGVRPYLQKCNLTVLDHGEHPEVAVEQQCDFRGGPSWQTRASIGIRSV